MGAKVADGLFIQAEQGLRYRFALCANMGLSYVLPTEIGDK
jgi:hypothetical protein